ncbi:uncharacterized protein [Dysidea avara]
MELIYGMIVLMCAVAYSGGQTCIGDVDDRQQIGSDEIGDHRIVIVPHLNFTCNGRVTNIRVGITSNGNGNASTYVEIWRPLPGLLFYSLVTSVEILPRHISQLPGANILEANIFLIGSNRTLFQSGDVIAFYLLRNSRYRIQVITTAGYMLYVFNGSSAITLNLIDADIISSARKPIIQFTLEIQCDHLSTPSNGEITSCSSGSTGVGYEGDTCNFTCNTGYELTGSDTRTCLSDGSWSGIQTRCTDIQCDDLTAPSNGETTLCTSGRVGAGYEGDTCSFTCNTGYELTGSDTRMCQSNGNWSGSDGVCRRVPCPSFTDPDNGMITCSLEDDGVPSYEDTCSFTCNTGYELTGSDTRTCQSDGSWSGTETMCRKVACPLLAVPNNGTITCSLGDNGIPSYEDTCSFTCNIGYELTGSDTKTCQNDGSWSGSDTSCSQIEVSQASDSEGSLSVVVGGTVGGLTVIVFIIIVVLIVLIYIRRSHQKKSYPVKAGITSNIYDEKNTKEEHYSEIVLPQLHRDDTIKMDSNPSYGSYTGQGSNIAIESNQSYGSKKPNRNVTKDQYDYARPTEFTNHPSHHDRENHVYMEPYGVIRGEGNSNMGCDITMESNPSYGVVTRMETNTKTTPGSDVTITTKPAYGNVKTKK